MVNTVGRERTLLKYTLVRDVTREECPWLDKDWTVGEEVFHFFGATYGCVSNMGTACSVDGDNPFFEMPTSALRIVRD